MRSLLITAACLAASAAPAFAEPPTYRLTRTVSLGTPEKWDYVTYDAASGRVLVAHFDHTDVVDAASGRTLGKLEGLHGAHGQVAAASGEIYADAGQSAEVTAFDPKTFRAIAHLRAGTDSDGVILEPVHGLVVVLNGEGQSATLVDTAKRSVKATVPLGGVPEMAVADGHGHIFVNIASTGAIAEIDPDVERVVACKNLGGCISPHGLAIDDTTHRLFSSCANAKLAVIDAGTLAVLQLLPIGRGTDAAAFDSKRRLVFSSNSEGTLSVFHESAAGVLTALGDIRTAPGARTMAIDPSSGRLFLVTADVDTAKPQAPGPHGPRYAWLPGTVKLLFLDPTPP